MDYRKESTEIKNIPVLVLSGLNDKASVSRAISLGATDYLLKPLRTTSLVQKAKKLMKVAAVLNHRFAMGQRPKVQLTLPAGILSANEVGLKIQSPVKLAPEAQIKLESTVLETLECKDVILKTTRKPSKFLELGIYSNEVNFVGVGEEFGKNIRPRLKRLK